MVALRTSGITRRWSPPTSRLEGWALDTMRLYERGRQAAARSGFIQKEGLVHKLAAGFCGARVLEMPPLRQPVESRQSLYSHRGQLWGPAPDV